MSHPPHRGSDLTTAEAAAVLKISAATLKRWAQSGLIPSERTEGGHRRFRFEAVRALAEPGHRSDDPVRRGADFVAGSCDLPSVQGWLLQARRELGSWWAVALPLRGVVAELYRRREAGGLGSVQLEVALDRLRSALGRCSDALSVPLDAPALLVAAVPGDPYLVAPALILLAASEAGWRADWAGHPEVADLAEELRRRPALAVIVCGSLGARPEVMASHAKGLEALAATQPAGFAIMGTGHWPEPSARLSRLGAVAEVRAWLEPLRRGGASPDAGEAVAHAGAVPPPELRWDPALALGHPTVDAQHRTLFLHAGRFLAAVRRGQADAAGMLAFIGDYAQAHFRTEENLMRECGYPSEREHQWEHEQFSRRLALLARNLEAGPTPEALTALAHFLAEWLRGHVGGSDQRIGAHLRRAPAT
jgi:hemerythrin-like metal-binding protein/excisionase family DNA binding protein